MTFRAPVADILASMNHVAGLERALAAGHFGELTADLVATVLEEAGKFATEVIAPINRIGDTEGAGAKDGRVTVPAPFTAAYRAFVAAGWNGIAAPEEFGGQGLPILVGSAVMEMVQSASMAFGNCPMLTAGAIDAIAAHGTRELKARYLEKLVSGEWTGTMNLTEPQAGSDLSALRARAERAGDGTYRVTGQKIFITWGEHDMVENILHLVLARLPDAPAGTRGLSLFLVPKVLPDGRANDVGCASIEHKLGIHGSPTCTMVFGDAGGAIGWLIGEENRGLACMFTMMNNARLAVALQGVAIAERATQQAMAFAAERRQGRAPDDSGPPGMSPIIRHPDVRRMLATMRAQTGAARALCHLVAISLDRAHRATDPAERKRAQERAGLLTPVAKAYSTDIGIEVASLGVQVHGGMGFVEETGAAQHLRDARIATIYEGTNGIQAIDLVTRKLPLSGGEAVRAEIALMRRVLRDLSGPVPPAFGATAARLRDAVEALDRATSWMLAAVSTAPAEALAGATPYLRLFGLARGGIGLAEIGLAAHRAMDAGDNDPAHPGRIALARFFAEHLATAAGGLEASVVTGAESVSEAALGLSS